EALPHSRQIFLHAYMVTALNPKGIVFYVAFMPQFLDTTQPLLPQLAILGPTFLVMATANSLLYGLMASAARRTIRKPAVQRAVNRAGGSILIGAGLLTLFWRRSAA